MHHEELSIFSWILRRMGIHLPDYLVMTLIIVGLFLVLMPLAARRFRVENPGRIQIVLEGLVGFLKGLLEDMVGSASVAKKHLPIVGMFFLFILLANYCGMVPGLQPPTASVNVTLSLAVMSFVYYNAAGVRKHGVRKYLAHFCGPMLAVAVLIFPVEIISHCVRVLSLSMRLFGNIFGEHTASGVFNSLIPFPILYPLFIMAIGLIASTLQAFIFTVLSMAYIGGAVAEEH